MAVSPGGFHRPVGPTTLSGCRPVPMTCDEVACCEGRYEYWEADTEAAWMVRDASPRHEEPRGRSNSGG